MLLSAAFSALQSSACESHGLASDMHTSAASSAFYKDSGSIPLGPNPVSSLSFSQQGPVPQVHWAQSFLVGVKVTVHTILFILKFLQLESFGVSE